MDIDQEIVRLVQSGRSGPEISQSLGISRERVRQRYRRATGRGLPRVVRGALCLACGTRYTGTRAAHRETPEHRQRLTRAERLLVRRGKP